MLRSADNYAKVIPFWGRFDFYKYTVNENNDEEEEENLILARIKK